MSMRGAIAGCVALACLVALLAERTEGHITFFSPKEMKLMRDREGSKDVGPRSEDGQFELVTAQQIPQEEHNGSPEKTVEISVRLSPKELDHVAPVLEEIIHELVVEQAK